MIKNSIKTELKRYLKVTSYETSKKYIRPDMTSQIRKQKTADSEVDRYLQESCKSYKECEIKNNARRNSLQKRTLGIETERKMANANLSREEKQLREQLKQMQIEKAKNDIMHNMRGKNTYSLFIFIRFFKYLSPAPKMQRAEQTYSKLQYVCLFQFAYPQQAYAMETNHVATTSFRHHVPAGHLVKF